MAYTMSNFTSPNAGVVVSNAGNETSTTAADGQAIQNIDQNAVKNPMSASGDIIYGGASGTPTRLAKGSDTQVLTLAAGVPSWAGATSNPQKELGVATSTTQRTSTSTASPGSDMTDYSVTVTPDGTHPVLVEVDIPEVFQSAAAIFHIALQKDGAIVNTSSFNAYTGPGRVIYRDAAPTNTTHTYKVSVWSNSAQTVTFLAGVGTEIGYVRANQLAT